MTTPKRPRMVRHAELVASDERLAIVHAALEQTRTSLAKLVRQIERAKGWSKPEDQADLREARAVLAEAGR